MGMHKKQILVMESLYCLVGTVWWDKYALKLFITCPNWLFACRTWGFDEGTTALAVLYSYTQIVALQHASRSLPFMPFCIFFNFTPKTVATWHLHVPWLYKANQVLMTKAWWDVYACVCQEVVVEMYKGLISFSSYSKDLFSRSDILNPFPHVYEYNYIENYSHLKPIWPIESNWQMTRLAM